MSKLKSIWKPTSTFHGIDLGNHFDLINFNEALDLNKVLSDGPWFLGSNFLSVRRWEPDFQPTKASLSTTIVWARHHSLPIEYYDHFILRKIGNTLGKLHKMDIHTVNGDRGRFARLCIQIDLAKPLIAKITVRSSLVKVAYEGLSSVCFHCGLIGHRVGECQNTANKNTTVENQANTPPADGEPFGPWMLVQKRPKSSKKPDPASHSNVQPRKVWVKKTEIQILAPNGQPQPLTSLTPSSATLIVDSDPTVLGVSLSNPFACLSDSPVTSLHPPSLSNTDLGPCPLLNPSPDISQSANNFSDPGDSSTLSTLFCVTTNPHPLATVSTTSSTPQPPQKKPSFRTPSSPHSLPNHATPKSPISPHQLSQHLHPSTQTSGRPNSPRTSSPFSSEQCGRVEPARLVLEDLEWSL
ncbi:mucin-2-like [Camellia sinensis]|uniref:mucin-2-like n=1 Tax=Camellia sinensis TaxID=4442 RepID=UPI0010366E71|nr:mucin-2-like [Camellia sinensis]